MLKSCERPLSEAYRLALLDLDGVVYRGKNAVPYASESIKEAENRGMTIEYTTNNSSRMQETVAQQLRGFGLDVKAYQVITSSVVAARMVAREVPKGASVLVLGAEHLQEEVSKQGLKVVSNAAEKPVAAIQGWYPQMTWELMAQMAYAVEDGAKYFVTNRDLTIPREQGIAPGCGSMIQAVINATGVEPIASAGKPQSAMYDEARMLAASNDEDLVPKEACLAIGDRLDTDIEAGTRGGYDTLAVLTGVTNPRELMRAPQHLRPHYIVQDLRGLNELQPQAHETADGSWACGQAYARIADNRLEVSDPSSIDALRAACALMWHAADTGSDAQDAELPDMHIA